MKRIKFNAGRLRGVYEIIPTIIFIRYPVTGTAIELHWLSLGIGIAFIKNELPDE